MTTDFIFDGEALSDYGYILCAFEGDSVSWEGGDVTFTTIKPPNSDKQVFYTSSQENSLTTTCCICKNPCDHEDIDITQEDYSEIYRWLQRTDGYHWLQFIQEDFDDIYYNSMINPEPYFINGKTVGFYLNITTDSPYAYSKLIRKNFTLNDETDCCTYQDYSDKPGSTYIRTKITPLDDGDIIIETGNDAYKNTTEIRNVISGNSIILDGESDYFSGIVNPNHFNFEFPIIVNTYKNRNNYFKKVNGVDCNIEIEYRYKRRVMV